MNLKLKALAKTVGVITTAVIVGLVTNTVANYFGPEIVANVIGFGILAGLAYLMYNLILGQLEAEEKIKSLTDKS